MNIFYTDTSPVIAAQNLCDCHVVKMILETAQMLSTAVILRNPNADPGLFYKPTHKNHPSSVWARSSLQNYNWLLEHFDAMNAEYTFRYGKTHKSFALFDSFVKYTPVLQRDPFWEPPQCMPDEYKMTTAVDGYRKYYNSKQHTMKKAMVWKVRQPPIWFEKLKDKE